MAALPHGLGAWTHRYRRTVLLTWLAVLIALGALAATAGGAYEDDFSIPGSRAQQTLRAVTEQFPASSGAYAQVVFVAPTGHRVAEHEAVIEQTLAAAARAPLVAGVVDRSPPGRSHRTVAPPWRPSPTASLETSARDALEDVFAAAREAGLRVEFGGSAYGGSAYGNKSDEEGRGADRAGRPRHHLRLAVRCRTPC